MKLNLSVLSLHTIDSLSYQKCLIPIDKVSRTVVWPGQWAKCYFVELSSGKQYYAVAQVFPRNDLNEVCYLDSCVTNCDFENHSELVLEKLIALENNQEIERAFVTLQLNADYFIENSSFLTKSYLQEMVKTLLQQYHLTHCSLIRDKFLLENGIDSIYLEIEKDCDSSTHIITDNTNVIIKNIALKYVEIRQDLVSLNVEPFGQARQKLDELINVIRAQRCSPKRSLCISLNAILVGAVGCGKTALVNEFLRSQRCNVFHVKITNCLKQYPGETEAELRKIFKAACDFENKFKATDPTIILLEEIHLLSPQPTSAVGKNSEASANCMRVCAELLSLVDGLFTCRSNIMCLASTSKLDNLNELVRRPGRFENEVYIAALQEKDRFVILKELLTQSMPSFNIKETLLENMAKQTQGFVLADLALIVLKVTQVVLTKPEENVELMIIDILKKSVPTSLKGADITAYKTTETFDSIGGMLQLKKKLEVSVLAGLKQQKSFERFGLNLPKGILLYGPPGCAKTTIAKCLANEANMTFIATSSAEVYSPYVGCAEKFIAKIFQTARKNSPCLIFLDEIDSLVGRRSIHGSSNSNDIQTRILSTLLTEMDGVIAPYGHNAQIVVLAATNRPDMIDDALMRPGRFDKLIHVPAPDYLSRRSILNLYKNKMPFTKSLDLDYLAVKTENYSGADICNLCNEAAMKAFQRDFNSEEIIIEDFENVLSASKSSLDKSKIDWYYEFENKFA